MIEDVIEALSRRRYRYSTEVDLHDGLAEALDDRGIAYEREVPMLPVGGRIDFVVDKVGIEVKIKGSAEALRRQIEGYAHSERIDEFLVVTTRPTHNVVRGHTNYGRKRVRVLTIGGLSL